MIRRTLISTLITASLLAGSAVAVAAGLAWLLPALAAGGERYEARLLGQVASRTSGAARCWCSSGTPTARTSVPPRLQS